MGLSGKKVRSSNYLKLFDKELKEAADSQGIDEKDTTDIIDYVYQKLLEKIQDPRLPVIRMGYLGSFVPTKNNIDNKIRRAIKSYREGRRPREHAVLIIKRYWHVRQRFIKESLGTFSYKDYENFDVESFTNEQRKIAKEKEDAKRKEREKEIALKGRAKRYYLGL